MGIDALASSNDTQIRFVLEALFGTAGQRARFQLNAVTRSRSEIVRGQVPVCIEQGEVSLGNPFLPSPVSSAFRSIGIRHDDVVRKLGSAHGDDLHLPFCCHCTPLAARFNGVRQSYVETVERDVVSPRDFLEKADLA